MNKTFKEYLGTLDGNTLVYMGTKNGSNWIVIDTVETILNNIERLEEIMHERVLKQHQTASNSVYEIPYKIVELRKTIDEEVVAKNKRKLEARLLDLENKFSNAFIMRKNTDEQLRKWVKIENRLVVEYYEQDGEEPGICVILEGSDNGTIWYRGEKNIL